MLGKLFKYEWRSITKLLLPVHGCILLFALLSRFYFSLGGGVEQLLSSKNGLVSVLTGLLIFALVVVICSVAIFTYIYTGYHLYKSVFTDQGYLTNTLPVTPAQLLLSKGFVALLWLLIDVAVIIISCLIIAGTKEIFSNLGLFLNSMVSYASQTPLFTTLLIIALIITPFQLVCMLFFSITLGSLASNHKILASIGAYVGIYIIQQIFGFLQLVFWGYSNSNLIMRINIYSNNYAFETFLNPILITGLTFNLLMTVICWIGSKYIMNRKLNLQ